MKPDYSDPVQDYFYSYRVARRRFVNEWSRYDLIEPFADDPAEVVALAQRYDLTGRRIHWHPAELPPETVLMLALEGLFGPRDDPPYGAGRAPLSSDIA